MDMTFAYFNEYITTVEINYKVSSHCPSRKPKNARQF